MVFAVSENLIPAVLAIPAVPVVPVVLAVPVVLRSSVTAKTHKTALELRVLASTHIKMYAVPCSFIWFQLVQFQWF